ncbi:MAG TPA: hypothetical protein VFZ83_02865 [Acidimicrobiia bacterium]|nr:hypothetical protein [Acidimicrobiia bacterium]
MILWYAAGAVFIVWNVFQSSGLDFRAVAVGALLPLALDAPFGRQGVAHSLLGAVVALAVVMLVTTGRGRRLARRRALGVPIGWFCGLVLSGAWANQEVFWWPVFGTDVPRVDLVPGLVVVAALEALGALAAGWIVVRFGLTDPRRRAAFARSGRLEVAG